ncbi:HEPN domain-containing protein [Fimbriiglobus ruber]|uniref:Uncharacterized protein n=1 Tax=Fimbriiglobus ruber TaxID=1908690 RepID=A0A225EAS6_9BACT|nr:HEPN domain-containing protein [Fimbriiglobus ruber]OWK45507.1 hypothetical protein FRUB_01838 [Fimbriiglobus ruber]
MSQDAEKEARLDTTLFDSFEYQGYFWLPATPDRKIPGVVRFASSDITLSLLGMLVETTLQQLAVVGPPFKADIILGQAQNGKKLTLYECTQIGTSTTIPHGTGSSTLSAGCLLIGKHFGSKADLLFHSLSINYLHLEEWLAYKPFPPQDEEKDAAGETTTYLSRYVVPDKLNYPVASLGCDILIDSQMFFGGFASFHKESREHVALLTVKPAAKQPFDWFLERIVDLQNLLTLLIGEPTFPKRTVLYGDEIAGPGFTYREDIQLFFHPAHGKIGERLHPVKMLAMFPAVSAHFGTILDSWFAKRELLENVCDLFFGVIYNNYLFLQFRFLGLIQALETYCRRVQGGKYLPEADYEKIAAALKAALPTTTPQDLRNSLVQGKIKYGNEYSLRKRLRELLCSLEDDTTKLVTPTLGKFCEEVTATRNYLTHYSSELQAQAFKGGDLYAAYLRLRLLVTIVLLKELGLDEKAIRDLLANSHSRLAESARMGYTVYV